MAKSVKACCSRRVNNPAMWSISPLVSRTDRKGDLRRSLGCRGGALSIWSRISGDAFKTAHSVPLALRASEDWVCAGIVPARARLQFSHPQFHCGKPPPAADPRTCARNVNATLRAQKYQNRSPSSCSRSPSGPYMLISIPHSISRIIGFDHAIVFPPQVTFSQLQVFVATSRLSMRLRYQTSEMNQIFK